MMDMRLMGCSNPADELAELERLLRRAEADRSPDGEFAAKIFRTLIRSRGGQCPDEGQAEFSVSDVGGRDRVKPPA